MHPARLFAGLGLAGLLFAMPGDALAQGCVDVANNDVLIVDNSTNSQVIKITDVSVGANSATNQEIVCGGTLPFPVSFDLDREGRIWVSVLDGVIRTDPFDPSGTAQVRAVQFTGLFASPEGILKQQDGPIFVAQPPIVADSQIVRYDEVNAIAMGFTALGATGIPLGLIFDPAGNDPEDMLLVDSGSIARQIAAGLYEINQSGGIIGVARNGFIATPFRLAASNSQYVYVTDIGGTVDPDGSGANGGPLPSETRMGQVVRVDRNVLFDFLDPAADGRVNQTVIAEAGVAGSNLVAPIGIVVLEEDGVYPDTLLVVDFAANGGALIRIDFDPAGVTPPIETIVAEGGNFVAPFEVKIASDIDPLPRQRLFFTDVGASPGTTGVFFVDPDGTSGAYATGLSAPAGVIVDPDSTDDLYVADPGVPSILRVTPGMPDMGVVTTVSSGGMLMSPANLIVDHQGDIIVADPGAGKLIRIDPTSGVQSTISEANLVQRPVAVGIDLDGYLFVSDEGDAMDDNDAKLLRVNPETGDQFCVDEDLVLRLDGFPLEIDNIPDLVVDSDASIVYSVASTDMPDPNAAQAPVIRFDPFQGFFEETFSANYETARGIAIAENRDMISVDAGDPAVLGDGRLARLDGIFPSTTNEPVDVNGATALSDPYGVTVAGRARPDHAPTDSDGDGVLDPQDNCVFTPNPGQEFPVLGEEFATEQNRFGEACRSSCDIDGNRAVGLSDISLLIATIGNDCNENEVLDCSADCAQPLDGVVGIPDVMAMLSQIGEVQTDIAGTLVKIPMNDADSCP